jgi:hypothetical protein
VFLRVLSKRTRTERSGNFLISQIQSWPGASVTPSSRTFGYRSNSTTLIGDLHGGVTGMSDKTIQRLHPAIRDDQAGRFGPAL